MADLTNLPTHAAIGPELRMLVLRVVAGARRMACSTGAGRAHPLQFDVLHQLRPSLRELRGHTDVLVDTPELSLDELYLAHRSRIEYGPYIERHSIRRLILNGAYFLCRRDTAVDMGSRFCNTLKELEMYAVHTRQFHILTALAERGLRLESWVVCIRANMVENRLPDVLSVTFELLRTFPQFASRALISADLHALWSDRLNLHSFCHNKLPDYLADRLGSPAFLDVHTGNDLASVFRRNGDKFYGIHFETTRVLVKINVHVHADVEWVYDEE